jgi:hypothetical protein
MSLSFLSLMETVTAYGKDFIFVIYVC